MTKYHQTIFISDIHLQENRPEITHRFLHLLKQSDHFTDAIYILGDLFEVWIGDDDDNFFNKQIISGLKQTTQKGIPIFIMHGNRDFLIGKKFLRDSGCKLLLEETKINVYHTPVLLLHGDTLCAEDIEYKKARKKLRNPILKSLFLMLPLTVRKKIATKMRQKSIAYSQLISLDKTDVTQSEVVNIMKKYNVHFLIHGHTHRPFFHSIKFEQLEGLRIVLGAWHEKGNMLIWNEKGEKNWIEF